MKSDHRHELKTNELADWLSHLPEWTKENLLTIVITVAAVIAAAAIYGWTIYNKNVVQAQEQTEFTNLINQVSGGKMQILQGQKEQGRDFSFVLLQPANTLESFAQKTNNKRMAAMALIKRAEALRAELHYGNVDEEYLINQTNQAKASYTEALEKSKANPSLAATAKFGIGLCEEELGNFEQAKAIYKDVAENPDYEYTLAKIRAKERLETMADYEQKIAFEPAPKPATPTVQTTPIGTGELPNIIQPFNFNRPLQFDMLPESKETDESNPPVDANVSGK
jgi:tetratricopeptide (TPR) repeat protein